MKTPTLYPDALGKAAPLERGNAKPEFKHRTVRADQWLRRNDTLAQKTRSKAAKSRQRKRWKAKQKRISRSH